MYSHKRKLLSQNFFRSRDLVSKLVRSSSIGKKDLVIEIGPGSGMITAELLQCAGTVVAVELDRYWYTSLRRSFSKTDNLVLYNQNFLQFQLPKTRYKVFANTPFSIEGKVIRKLLESTHPPQDMYLVVVKDFASRLSGKYGATMFSMMHAPWFTFSIEHAFSRHDFAPVPAIDAVLLRCVQREDPLISFDQRKRFCNFITVGYRNGQAVWKNMRGIYLPVVVEKAFQTLSLRRKVRPSQLTLRMWIKLFKTLESISLAPAQGKKD